MISRAGVHRLTRRFAQFVCETRLETASLNAVIARLARSTREAGKSAPVLPDIVVVHRQMWATTLHILVMVRAVPHVRVVTASTVTALSHEVAEAVAEGARTILLSRTLYQTMRTASAAIPQSANVLLFSV